MKNVETKLNIYFALLAGLCGLTFSGSQELGALPFIAVFFAAFGLVFVDLLRWFALPPMMSYLALGAIAFYTINRFYNIGSFSPEPQMVAVAELLVLVQSVLMLQRKNRRIYEQLVVFALLQLIVAAIFNNAVSYGLLLVPLSASLIGALTLLHISSTSQDAFVGPSLLHHNLRVQSPESSRSFVDASSLLPRIGWLTVAPSVMIIAFVFFYALPRTNEQARRGIGGEAQVGFNSEVRLGQIGKMLANPEVALRIDARNRSTGDRYDIVGDFYVRGTVLENYNAGRTYDGTWSATETDPVMGPRQLPAAPTIRSGNERLMHDDVVLRFNVSPMRADALFSVPPYYFDMSGPDVAHTLDRWVINRRTRPLFGRNSQIAYRFATQSFRDGIQCAFLPRFAERERLSDEPRIQSGEDERKSSSTKSDGSTDTDAGDPTQSVNNAEPLLIKDLDDAPVDENELELRATREYLLVDEARSASNYRQACLRYDEDMVPSAVRVAGTALGRMARDQGNPVAVARQMERFLSSGKSYTYTLDLTMDPIPGIDPIEQFLTIDRRGNCQHFASSLVLMLRSQGIPARMVVGFNTDEYNAIGGYFVARQLHAHAWVEALMDAKWLKPNELHYSSIPAKEYWMRLDPTPGGGGTNQLIGGRVSNVIDLAQDMWTSYVVDADAGDRRRGELNYASDGMSGSYQMYYEWVKLKVSRIRAGELGAGALADPNSFSWRAALLAVFVLLGSVAAYQFGLPRWISGSSGEQVSGEKLSIPSIPFFAETVSLLESLGIRRRIGQTPSEYTSDAARLLAEPNSEPLEIPLAELTSAFYSERFRRGGKVDETMAFASASDRINLALQSLRNRVLRNSQAKQSVAPGGNGQTQSSQPTA